MRFLMLSWRDPRNPRAGGAERVTEAYWAALKERGHEVYWYANEFPGCTSEETIRGIQIVRGGGSGSSVLKAVRWYRRQPRFDLVVDQHHGIPWLAPWWARTNCLAYLHEVLGPIWSSFYKPPLNTVGRWQERAVHWLYRNVPFWVGSESTQRALHRRGVRNVTVIHYGIDLKPLAELEPKPLKEQLELIAVSRLAPNKRIDHAILALQVLRDRGVNARLTVVGDGDMAVQLKRLTMESETGLSDVVTFTGPLPEAEKNAQLRRSHLLIHTSVREGWGLNVLEANAMGTPAVVYPVDGLVDATIHDETGIVTKAQTPESVADGIMELLKRPERYEVYRRNACKRTEEFHWERILPKACDWLEQQARRGTGAVQSAERKAQS
jgi:glycosyltransferase involved in cell wall biosynthesis